MVKELNKSMYKKDSMFVYGIDSDMCNDREIYLQYRNGVQRDYTDDDMLNLVILKLLEENGFLLEDVGTYLYKDIIKNVIKCLKNSSLDIEKLKCELSSQYSQFYFDISRNERDMGVKSFHSYIKEAIMNLKDNSKFSLLFSKFDYGQLAYEVACYIMDSDMLDKCDGKNVVKVRKNNEVNF